MVSSEEFDEFNEHIEKKYTPMFSRIELAHVAVRLNRIFENSSKDIELENEVRSQYSKVREQWDRLVEYQKYLDTESQLNQHQEDDISWI